MIGFLALAAIAGELCATPAPAPSTQPVEAARYADVGDAERAAGQPRTALVAYRRALELDPGQPRALRAWRELCVSGAPAPPAAERLQAGIARYRAGEVDAARADLEAAAAADGELAGAAHFFLAMIALRANQNAAAEHELALAARDPAFAEPARDVRRLARRSGRLALSIMLAPEWDSNVPRLADAPATPTGGGRSSDGALLTAAAATGRPGGDLALRAAVSWRKHLELVGFDQLGLRAGVGTEPSWGAHHLGVRLDVDHERVGGAAYGTDGTAELGYRFAPPAGPLAGAALRLTRRDFDADEAEPFSGWVHAAAAHAGFRGGRVEVTVALEGASEVTRDPALDAWTAGVDIDLRWQAAAGVRLSASTAATRAWYDGGLDTAKRSDLRLAAALELQVDVGDHLALLAGIDAERNQSTDVELDLSKLVIRAGAIAFLGLL